MNAVRAADVAAETMSVRPDVRARWEQIAARRHLAAHLVGARSSAGLSADELAARSGLSEQQIASAESATGPVPPPADIAAYLAGCHAPEPAAGGSPSKGGVAALVALQAAGIEAIVAAQKLMLDLAQTTAMQQVETIKSMMAQGVDSDRQPMAYAAAVEKAMADVREAMELGIKAQSEVADLFVRRASAHEGAASHDVPRRPMKVG